MAEMQKKRFKDVEDENERLQEQVIQLKKEKANLESQSLLMEQLTPGA